MLNATKMNPKYIAIAALNLAPYYRAKNEFCQLLDILSAHTTATLDAMPTK
jgi:hypothetical protein